MYIETKHPTFTNSLPQVRHPATAPHAQHSLTAQTARRPASCLHPAPSPSPPGLLAVLCFAGQVRAAQTSLEAIVLSALSAAGYPLAATLNSAEWLAAPVFLQSFEVGSLKAMARHSCLPLVLLLGEWDG